MVKKGKLEEIFSKARFVGDPNSYKIVYRDFEKFRKISIPEFLLLSLLTFAIVVISIIIYVSQKYGFTWLSSDKTVFQRISNFPWELMIILFSLIALIYMLGKNIGTTYRHPVAIIFLAICASIACGYAITENTGINDWFASKPIISEIYERRGKFSQRQDIKTVHGKFVSINDGMLTLENKFGKTCSFLVTDQTIELDDITYEPGIFLVVITQEKDNIIEAVYIKSTKEFIPRGIQKLNYIKTHQEHSVLYY